MRYCTTVVRYRPAIGQLAPTLYCLVRTVGADADMSHMPIGDCDLTNELRAAPTLISARLNRLTANP